MTDERDTSRLERFAEALGADFVMPVEEALGVSADSLTHPLGMMAAARAFTERQARLRAEASAVVDPESGSGQAQKAK